MKRAAHQSKSSSSYIWIYPYILYRLILIFPQSIVQHNGDREEKRELLISAEVYILDWATQPGPKICVCVCDEREREMWARHSWRERESLAINNLMMKKSPPVPQSLQHGRVWIVYSVWRNRRVTLNFSAVTEDGGANPDMFPGKITSSPE